MSNERVINAIILLAVAFGLAGCANGDNELQHLGLRMWLHHGGPLL